MTFQFACRKPQSGKVLGPAGPSQKSSIQYRESSIQYRESSIQNRVSSIENRESRIENPTLAHFRHFSSLLTNLPSTFVENALQIDLFMQNKPNFRKSQMNVKSFNTVDYENKSNWTLGENKPKTNPKQTQSKPISKKPK